MSVTIEKHYFAGNGRIPNSRLPLIIYRNVLQFTPRQEEEIMRANHWLTAWYAHEGMWPRHHFHTEAHELILVTRGEHEGKFGGHGGIHARLRAGDAVLNPAGVGHMGIGYTEDLNLIGSFPEGFGIVDFRIGYPEEYLECQRRAAAVPIPAHDPFFGLNGPLCEIWRAADLGDQGKATITYEDALLTQPETQEAVG